MLHTSLFQPSLWCLPYNRHTSISWALLLMILTVFPISTNAENSPPKQNNDVFTIAIIGDSLANGIWFPFYHRLKRNKLVNVVNYCHSATGLARPDNFDWTTGVDDFLLKNNVDAALLSIGLNDMQAIYVDGKRHYPFRSDDWNKLYIERIDILMQGLVKREIQTFWIGLPIMRSEQYSNNIQHLNSMFKQQTTTHGVHYLPLWDITTNEAGAYSSYLRDSKGRMRLMRANDGIHFTFKGYNMLARHVLHVMRNKLPVLNTNTDQKNLSNK